MDKAFYNEAVDRQLPYSPQALRAALVIFLRHWDDETPDEDIVTALDEASDLADLPYEIEVDETLETKTPYQVSGLITSVAIYLTGKTF
jgi:hypothetical protein